MSNKLSSKTASYAELLVMIAERDAEIARLRMALDAEQNAHAALQARCYDGGGSDIFIDIARLREELRMEQQWRLRHRCSDETSARHTLDCSMVKHPNCTRCDCGSSIDTESQSAPTGGEKIEGRDSTDRGIPRHAAAAQPIYGVERHTDRGQSPAQPARDPAPEEGNRKSSELPRGKGTPGQTSAQKTPGPRCMFAAEGRRCVLTDPHEGAHELDEPPGKPSGDRCICGRGENFHPWRFCDKYQPVSGGEHGN